MYWARIGCGSLFVTIVDWLVLPWNICSNNKECPGRVFKKSYLKPEFKKIILEHTLTQNLPQTKYQSVLWLNGKGKSHLLKSRLAIFTFIDSLFMTEVLDQFALKCLFHTTELHTLSTFVQVTPFKLYDNRNSVTHLWRTGCPCVDTWVTRRGELRLTCRYGATSDDPEHQAPLPRPTEYELFSLPSPGR